MTRDYIFNEAAPSLFDGGWRASDRTDLVREYDLNEEEAEWMVEALMDMETGNAPDTWYAVLTDKDDNDWGTGSYDMQTAFDMARDMGAQYVAVIDKGGDPICTEIIEIDQ